MSWAHRDLWMKNVEAGGKAKAFWRALVFWLGWMETGPLVLRTSINPGRVNLCSLVLFVLLIRIRLVGRNSRSRSLTASIMRGGRGLASLDKLAAC